MRWDVGLELSGIILQKMKFQFGENVMTILYLSTGDKSELESGKYENNKPKNPSRMSESVARAPKSLKAYANKTSK